MNESAQNQSEHQTENCYPPPREKTMLQLLSTGFLAGAVATISLIRLIKK